MNDRELAETITLIDTALASENEAVKNALDKLIMLVNLSGEEKEGPIAEELFRLRQDLISKDIVIERLNEIIERKRQTKIYTSNSQWTSTTTSWK